LVWYAVVRAAFKALQLPHVVNVATADNAEWFALLLARVRRGEVHGVRVCGHHGHDALEQSDEQDASAQRARVADTLVAVRGASVLAYCTDSLGMTDWMQQRGVQPNTVVMIGSGTQAMSVAAACESAGAKVIGTTSRSWRSTEELHEAPAAERLRNMGLLTMLWPSPGAAPSPSHFSEVMRLQLSDLACSADLLVQASPAGTNSGPEGDRIAQSIPWERMRPKAVICDLAYRQGPTPLLRAAREKNLVAIGGVEVLLDQAVRTIEIWTGLRPPLAPLQLAAERASVELGR
jgi:shikimate 5-dehydrogenase